MRHARVMFRRSRWKFPSTFAHAWKQPGSICRRCFGRWTACFGAGADPATAIRQLFELDADYVEALWGLDQPPGKLNPRAMLRDTLAALEQLPVACSRFRKALPSQAQPTLSQLELTVRVTLSPTEAYNMVPGRDPQNG